jgi:DNA-binding transcriptional LysR family regulator
MAQYSKQNVFNGSLNWGVPPTPHNNFTCIQNGPRYFVWRAALSINVTLFARWHQNDAYNIWVGAPGDKELVWPHTPNKMCSMDRLTTMTTFVKVVELGSLSATADYLKISSQLVGKQVKALEHHLGVRLLNRTTRKQSLTDFGRTFYERAKIILAEVEAAEGMAAETRAIPSGRLRINAPVTFGVRTLSSRLLEYMARYPEVKVDLTLSNRVVDLVEEGYDAVFRIGGLADSGLIARSLGIYHLVLCAAPSYLAKRPPLLTPWDLQQHECLGFAYSDGRTEWIFEGSEGCIVVPISSRLRVN